MANITIYISQKLGEDLRRCDDRHYGRRSGAVFPLILQNFIDFAIR